MKSKCSQNAAKIQSKYNQNAGKMQPKGSQNAGKMYLKCSQISGKMYSKCSQISVKMQPKCRQNAVKIQSVLGVAYRLKSFQSRSKKFSACYSLLSWKLFCYRICQTLPVPLFAKDTSKLRQAPLQLQIWTKMMNKVK